MSRRKKKLIIRRRRISREEIEEQAIYVEEILGPAIIGERKTEGIKAAPEVAEPKAILALEEKLKVLELGPNVKVCFPDSKDLKFEQRSPEKGLYSIDLFKAGESLSIYRDVETGEVGIGAKDYKIRGDRLIELEKWNKWNLLLDVARRERKREFLLERKGENVMIDLRKIEEDELKQFLGK